MIRWIPYVFVRIAFFFIAGILLGIFFPDLLPEKVIWIVCAGLFLMYSVCVYLQRRSGKLTITGLIGVGTVFIAGYSHVLLQTDSRKPDHILQINKPLEFYKATIIRSPDKKDKTWKFEAQIDAIKSKGGWEKCIGKVILYFPRKDSVSPYRYGDVLLIRGSPQQVPAPANPEEFDYRQFLAFKNIYCQDFLKNGDVKWIAHNPLSFVMDQAYSSRVWCDATLKRYVKGDREQAIASALVLGVNDGLDNELLSAYAGTGTLHVLSVSGLHVSIIYLIIVFLLRPFRKLKSGKFILAFFSVLILWGYAFITGLSPSVLRAVTMFSFVAVARPWNQRTNIYNTLAISAFFLLLYDPFLIMSVGFQLSYLAVLGIVYIQPGLYDLWEPNYKIVNEVWKVTTVSIAAQVATSALGLLYFHQFPNYFLLSNLLVIPESFGVLIVGLGVLVFNFIEPVAHVLGILLQCIIKVMNITVFTIESFPFSLIDGVYINSFQCVLLMLFMLMIILSFKQKKFNYIVAGASFMVIFSGIQWMAFYRQINIQKIAVYNVQGHSAFDLIDARQTYFFADSVLINDKKKITFHISPNRILHGVTIVQDGKSQLFRKKFTGCNLTRWKGKNILYIADRIFDFPEQLHIDYCIIANDAVKDLEKIRERLNFAKLILDSSNTFHFSSKIMMQARKLNINIHSVLHHGAFVASL